jgi:N,N-dimethylformamidase
LAKTRLFGYAEPLNPKAGSRVDILVSAEGARETDAQLVRLLHGDQNAEGPGFVEEEIGNPVNGSLAVKRQFTQIGSFAVAEDPEGRLDDLASFTLFAHVFPTLAKTERQVIMGRWSVDGNSGYALGIEPEGKLSFWVGDGERSDWITADTPLVPHCWFLVAASFDARTKKAGLHVISCINQWNSRISTVVPFGLDNRVEEKLRTSPGRTGSVARFLLAGASETNPRRGAFVSMLFNGKIDRAGIYSGVLPRKLIEALASGDAPPDEALLAYWDPTVGLSDTGIGDRIDDTGPHGLHLTGINHPVRCMTGFNWKGADSFRLAPDQYGGVHFHDDAVTDCRWDVTCSIDLPEDLRSGVHRSVAADLYLSRLRKRTPRLRGTDRPGDHRTHAGDRGRGPGIQETRGIRPVDLRSPQRRGRLLLQQLAPADHQPAAEIPHAGDELPVGAAGRPVSDLVDGAVGIRLRRDHRS